MDGSPHRQSPDPADIPADQCTDAQMSSVSMAPEVGQSFATAQQEAAKRLASSIADLMEIAW
jgi:hypothetical protein